MTPLPFVKLLQNLHRVWFFVGWFSGSVVTTLGPKITLMLGTLGYPVFVGGLWYCTWASMRYQGLIAKRSQLPSLVTYGILYLEELSWV